MKKLIENLKDQVNFLKREIERTRVKEKGEEDEEKEEKEEEEEENPFDKDKVDSQVIEDLKKEIEDLKKLLDEYVI